MGLQQQTERDVVVSAPQRRTDIVVVHRSMLDGKPGRTRTL